MGPCAVCCVWQPLRWRGGIVGIERPPDASSACPTRHGRASDGFLARRHNASCTGSVRRLSIRSHSRAIRRDDRVAPPCSRDGRRILSPAVATHNRAAAQRIERRCWGHADTHPRRSRPDPHPRRRGVRRQEHAYRSPSAIHPARAAPHPVARRTGEPAGPSFAHCLSSLARISSRRQPG